MVFIWCHQNSKTWTIDSTKLFFLHILDIQNLYAKFGISIQWFVLKIKHFEMCDVLDERVSQELPQKRIFNLIFRRDNNWEVISKERWIESWWWFLVESTLYYLLCNFMTAIFVSLSRTPTAYTKYCNFMKIIFVITRYEKRHKAIIWTQHVFLPAL